MPDATLAACRSAPTGSSPSAPPWCARSSRRPRGRLEGRTDLFIRRGYQFARRRRLLTNFHVPRTTLLALVDAFVGPRWRDLYATALRRGLPVPLLRRRHAPRPPSAMSRRGSTVDVEATRRRRRRAGRGDDRRGATFATPCFMPVGTRGAVRTSTPATSSALGAEVVLANTYHLMLRPGADVVAALGGLHGFTAWPGHMLTDSGGFQVFSLAPTVDDDGVTFRSTYDGSAHRLTPEAAVDVQELLGADIQMVLDVCPPLPSPPEVVRLAVERTAAWAARGPGRATGATGQALFGIVQGGIDARAAGRERPPHRRPRLRRLRHRRAVGGRDAAPRCCRRWPRPPAELPADQPRYLMGVGDPVGPGRGDRPRRRHVRLRAADPPRPPRHGAHRRRAAEPAQRRSTTRRRPARRRRARARCAPAGPGRYLRHLLQVHEPTAPAARHHPQPGVDPAPRRPAARAAIAGGHVRRGCAPRCSAVWAWRRDSGPRPSNRRPPPMGAFIILVVTFGLMWVLFILPAAAAGAGAPGAGRDARRRRRGDDHGRHLRHDRRARRREVQLEVAPGVELRFARGAIARRVDQVLPEHRSGRSTTDGTEDWSTSTTSRRPPAGHRAPWPHAAAASDGEPLAE